MDCHVNVMHMYMCVSVYWNHGMNPIFISLTYRHCCWMIT